MADQDTPSPAPEAADSGAESYLDDIASRHGVESSDLTPEAEEAPAAEAADAEPGSGEDAAAERPSLHDRWRERTSDPYSTDPYGPLRYQIDKMGQQLEALSKPPAETPKPPPVENAEEYLRWHQREAIAPDLAELREGLGEVRGYIQSRAAEQEADRQRQAAVGQMEALEHEYEAEVPGHRARLGAFVQTRTEELVQEYGASRPDASRRVVEEIQAHLLSAGSLRAHPVAFLDREVSRYLDANGVTVPDASAGAGEGAGEGSPSPSPAPASRAVSERATAAGSAAAGSLGSLPRAAGPKKVTARAMLRRGKDLTRKEFEQAVAERLPEFGNNPHAAMAAVREELYGASQAAS